MNPQVDHYIEKHPQWQKELLYLRQLLLECGFTEELKWGAPCYTYNKANLIGLNGFKNHIALWFYKGVLLSDQKKRLIKSHKNTQAMRQMHFKTFEDVVSHTQDLKEYLFETIEAEKAGLQVPKIKKELIIPPELQEKLNEIDFLKTAFNSLSSGKKQVYANYISEAKQESTKERRLKKIIPLILDQKGLNDQY